MRDFRNKVAAITGAGSGMGRALALELAARGCAVGDRRRRPRVAERDRVDAARHEGEGVVPPGRRGGPRRDGAVRRRRRARARQSESGVQQRRRLGHQHRREAQLRRLRVVDEHQLLGRRARHEGVPAVPAAGGRSAHHQHVEHLRRGRVPEPGRLQRVEVRGARLHGGAAAGTGRNAHRRQLRSTRRREDEHRQDLALLRHGQRGAHQRRNDA